MSIAMRWLRRLLLALFSKEVGLAELASALATILWGVIMVTTTPLPTWRSLDLLLRFWDSDVWGWLHIGLGFGQLALFPLIDRRFTRSWFRLGGAAALSALWGMNLASAFVPEVKLLVGQAWGDPMMFEAAAPCPPWTAAIFMGWFVNFYLIFRVSLVRH